MSLRALVLVFVALLLLGSACEFSASVSVGDSDPSVKSAQLARGYDEKANKAVDPTTSFKPQDNPFHLVIKIDNAEDGTRVRTVWTAVDAGGEKDATIDEVVYTTKGSEDVVHATLSLPGDWPEGRYRVDVYLNDNLDKAIDFSVQ